jgi:hypothetical protein
MEKNNNAIPGCRREGGDVTRNEDEGRECHEGAGVTEVVILNIRESARVCIIY